MSTEATEPLTDPVVDPPIVEPNPDGGDPPIVEPKTAPDYTGKTIEELQALIIGKDNRLKDVTAESIKRKEKLREIAATQEEADKTSLIEQNKYKELYDKELLKNQELTPIIEGLNTFKDEVTKREEAKVSELETKLAANEREEYEMLKDSLPVAKKIQYLENKLSNRNGINIASTRGNNGTSVTDFPKNNKELFALGAEKMKELKQQNPEKYLEVMAIEPGREPKAN